MRLIDADALTQTLGITDIDCDKCAWGDKKWSRCKRGGDFEDACFAIYDAPTIEERKKGQWRNIQIGEWLGVECTACKIAHDWREVPHVNGGGVAWYFCPECGADMRGEEHEHND